MPVRRRRIVREDRLDQRVRAPVVEEEDALANTPERSTAEPERVVIDATWHSLRPIWLNASRPRCALASNGKSDMTSSGLLKLESPDVPVRVTSLGSAPRLQS